MTEPGATAMEAERAHALTAVALSDERRRGARLVTGVHRAFGLSASLSYVHVPHPPIEPGWSRRTMTCGVALQCSPSKDRLAHFRLHDLSTGERRVLSLVEAEVAMGWIARCWPGLVGEVTRLLPQLEARDPDTDAETMIGRAIELACAGDARPAHLLLGELPVHRSETERWGDTMRRRLGRMPWNTTQKRMPRAHSVPVGGDGGVRNPNLPPPSRPDDDDVSGTPENRPGIPYPEWNAWTQRFLPDHVAVLETVHGTRTDGPATTPDLRRWFMQNTHRSMTGGLEDGSDLDVDRYVRHALDTRTGQAAQPRVFRDLVPGDRDVSTALLLDGSSSLGVHGGRVFRLELACADALSQAMTRARERHGVFVFTGNTRHRVEVRCLKSFDDRRFVAPSAAGLVTGGYTRLGAPLRHLTSRLLSQPAQRRLLIVIGDGLISDEGYEGRYAWADTAHAVSEANDAGVSIYYIGVGPTRVDPLPEVFGSRRSQRIRRIEDLPRVLAHVHRELVAQ